MDRLGRGRKWLALGTVCLLSACASEYVKVAPKPAENYTRLGPATGSACGVLGILGTITNFAPFGQNDRVQRAYADALASVPGSTGLVNVTMRENWYWWVLATSRCVTITGEAVK